MKILQYPNKILANVSKNVDIEKGSNTASFLERAYSELPSTTRVGLAAPQVGVNQNVAIVMDEPMMNLEWKGAEQFQTEQEGCFSIENATKFFLKTRNKYGWAKWQDPYTGQKFEEKLTGFRARVFQHELDHINGKLCHE